MNIVDKNVERDVDAIIKKDVYKIMKETSQASRDAISAFYEDYTPSVYRRVYGLKDIFNIDLSRITNGYILKFTYSFSNIKGHGNPSVIFAGPFMQGYHGGPAWGGEEFAPKMTPSPWDMIESFAENIGGIIQ